MRIIRDYTFVDPDARGASAAIGNFDGVHIGNQSVIDLARNAGANICLLYTSPSPRDRG